MNVTLKAVCKTKDYSPFELLKAKQEMIQLKKQGRLFFDCNIARLNWEDEFQIYLHALPHHRSEINAFPVPLERFQLHRNEQIQADYLKEYFESYYAGENWNEEWAHLYTEQKPFVGEEYVWYFKRNVCFS